MSAAPTSPRPQPTPAQSSDILHRWTILRQDTSTIAALTGIEHLTVCRVIAAWQDARHALRQREAQHA
jgi:hypothetical protein